MHAMIRENVGPPIGRGTPLRPDAYQREVRRATADVGHQHERLARCAGFEVVRRGDGLELELERTLRPGAISVVSCIRSEPRMLLSDRINRPSTPSTYAATAARP
jgi:hypothetical protein